MRHLGTAALCAGLLGTALSGALQAQTTTEIHPGRGGSPHVRSEWTVGEATVSIEYGRPYLKGRTIGQDIVPYGQVWRTGADEATTLTTDREVMFGNTMVPAGTYTLYTLPGPRSWQLIVNRQTGQWGTEYDADQDLARIEMKVATLSPPLEQLTLSIESGQFRIEWGSVRASVPFMVH